MFSGAVYQAAALSKAFVVKKFLVREATIYPIEVILHVFIHAQTCHKHEYMLALQVHTKILTCAIKCCGYQLSDICTCSYVFTVCVLIDHIN